MKFIPLLWTWLRGARKKKNKREQGHQEGGGQSADLRRPSLFLPLFPATRYYKLHSYVCMSVPDIRRRLSGHWYVCVLHIKLTFSPIYIQRNFVQQYY